jgi:hypothetical protein
MDTEQSFEPNIIYSGVKPLWVLMGVAIDWALTIIFVIVTMPIFFDSGALELSESEFAEHSEVVRQGAGYLVTSLLMGALATVIGAFFAARKAGAVHLKQGLWVSIASAVFYLVIPDGELGDVIPLWAEVASWSILLPSGILGGYLAKHIPRAKQ